MASWRLSRFVEAAPAGNANAWQRFLTAGAGFGKKQRRPPLLEINPVLWLLEDSPRLRWINWGLCAAGILLMLFCMIESSGPRLMLVTYSTAPFLFLLKVLFAIQACRFFSESRRNGMIEMFRVTPLSFQTMIDGQWLALRRLFLWPVTVLLSVEFFFMFLPVVGTSARSSPVMSILGLAFGVPWELLKSLADFFAIGWFGMWLALTGKRPQSAAGLTILFVIILPAAALCVPSCVIDLVLILVYRGKLRRAGMGNFEF